MPKFEDLPPLSPERLAELVSASADDADPFSRHWVTGQYENPSLEESYRIFHLRLWAPRVQLLLVLCCVASYSVSLHTETQKVVVSSSNRISVQFDAHSESRSLTHTHCSITRTC
jgi:hypothetical protein